MNMREKCYWNRKRKLGVTTHFSKIINQQYLYRALKSKQCIAFFSKLKLNYLWKNAWLLPIFFLDTKSICWVLLSPHSFKLRKNILVLVSTTNSMIRGAGQEDRSSGNENAPIGNLSILICAERMRSNDSRHRPQFAWFKSVLSHILSVRWAPVSVKSSKPHPLPTVLHWACLKHEMTK